MTPPPTTPRILADGALLRMATPADAAAYAALATHAFVIGNSDEPNPNVAGYAHDLSSDLHPLCYSDDIALVARGDEVIAAAALMTQPLRYGGIPVPAGRPELVCSHTDVRQRGYIREIMATLHAKSEARGDLVQVITGIPHYYHQYGYAWAIDYNGYARVTSATVRAKPTSDQSVTIRRFAADEYATFHALYQADRATSGCLVTTPFSEAYFRHAIETTRSTEGFAAYGIYDATPECVGYLLLEKRIWDGAVVIHAWGYRDPEGMQRYGIGTLHAIDAVAAALPKPVRSHTEYTQIDISTDGGNPIRTALTVLGIAFTDIAPYTWYIRVPDMSRLLLHIAPVLEHRLAQSALAGYTGTLDITTYRSGVVLQWDNGTLSHVGPRTKLPYGDNPDASYHPEGLIQQVFGWRSFAELSAWYPDVWTSPKTAILLDVLFPKQPSRLLWMN